jgi:hypothetical protein
VERLGVGQSEPDGGLADGPSGGHLTQVQRGGATQVRQVDAVEVGEIVLEPVGLQELGDVFGPERGPADRVAQCPAPSVAGVGLQDRGDGLP